MNGIIHNHLNGLRIISKIRVGQKINTINGLSVYKEGFMSWVNRIWFKDSKIETLRVLTELYTVIYKNVDDIIKNDNLTKSDLNTRNYLLIKLAEQLRSSVTGIENLSKTYINYQTTTAGLEGIVHDYLIITYQTIIENIIIDESPELKKNIVYNNDVIFKYESSSKNKLTVPIPSNILTEENLEIHDEIASGTSLTSTNSLP